jgi:hypothetical protein
MPHLFPARRRLTDFLCLRAPMLFGGLLLAVAGEGGFRSGSVLAAPSQAPQPGAVEPRQEPEAPAPLRPLEGDLGRPYDLPSASRARMHECALAWQHLKLSGGAANVTWRVFAAGCLSAPEVKSVGPADANGPALDAPDAKK